MSDPVNHPSHYTLGKVECIDALEAATVNLTGIEAVCTANAIKYLWRWKQKNGQEDLLKARWYLDRMIKEPAPAPVRVDLEHLKQLKHEWADRIYAQVSERAGLHHNGSIAGHLVDVLREVLR